MTTDYRCLLLKKVGVLSLELEIENAYCHHKKPLITGVEDKYKNLIFVTKAIHRLIHEPDESKIKLITTALLLDKRQAKKLSVLRGLANS